MPALLMFFPTVSILTVAGHTGGYWVISKMCPAPIGPGDICIFETLESNMYKLITILLMYISNGPTQQVIESEWVTISS